MTVMDAKDLTALPKWHNLPDEHEGREVLYRNGDARLVVSRVWDDYAFWAEDEGQIPFWSPEKGMGSDLGTNLGWSPDESDLDRALYWLGDLELVARWLRIFHGAEIAQVDRIKTGYVQGSFRDVLTIVTEEWRDYVGVPLDLVRKEIERGTHLKDFAAWCAGDYLHATIEVADPDPACYAIAMDPAERDEADGLHWDRVDSWTDAMDGPLHTIEDVNEWLSDACMCTDSEAKLALERRQEVTANGHWVI